MTAEASAGPGGAVGRLRAKRSADLNRRSREREARWRNQRYSVPYPTDGPKITLGVLWAVSAVAATLRSWPALLALAGAVAVVAGLQTGHAWAKHTTSDRRMCAVLAGIVAAGAAAGTLGLGIAVCLSVIAALGFAAFGVSHRVRSAEERRAAVLRLADVTVRSSVPVGIAAGSLAALAQVDSGAALTLIVLISAYEAGDFLIGTGSANAVEGPVAGIVSLAVVAFGFFLFYPGPLGGEAFPLFAALAALSAPVGQIAASAILPRGDAWAPALRRLDSHLLAAPLFVLLL